jgi:hypothetical protein
VHAVKIRIEHGAIPNGNPRAGGWLPAVWINGRGPQGNTWSARGYDKHQAEHLARDEAEEEASGYVGDWEITISPRDGAVESKTEES